MRTKMDNTQPTAACLWPDMHHHIARTSVAFITVHSVLRALFSSFRLHSVKKSGLFYIQQIKLMYIYLAK